MAVVTAIALKASVRLPLESLVLDGATIARLAERIDNRAEAPASATRLTTLNRSSRTQPLFAMPVIGGHLSDYLALAHHLEDFAPVLGLPFDEGLPANSHRPSVAELAAQAIRAIPMPEPGAPITLVGYSYGGIISFEAAHSLAAMGAHVRLIIIDSVPAWLDPVRHIRLAWQAARRGDVGASGRRLLDLAAAFTGTRAAAKSLEEAHLTAVQDYTPAPLPNVRAALICSDENRNSAFTDEWRRLLPASLTVTNVPGDHMTMMREPFVPAVGRAVRTWLT